MGTELVTLQHCMLLFGEVISDLRHITMEFSDWMVNNHPPWAVYRTHMYISLVGLNKHPVVQHVGVGKTWKRIMAKCVMKVAGHGLPRMTSRTGPCLPDILYSDRGHTAPLMECRSSGY